MCFICSAACKLIQWLIALSFVVVFVGALLLGAYVLGPVVNKDSKSSTTAPSVYEYYTEGGIAEGLKAGKNNFTLNKRVISLFSGSIHYFRVHPDYWRDRLRKLRAAGFVAVETYVPWNLHEPYKGVFDFGDGGEDMSPFLDIRTFLKIAQEEDLLAILRPGPYICAEWEFGGLPSWLLNEANIQVRTSDPVYMKYVRLYFERLLPILKNLQFTTKQGPIIAFQVENEYGNTKSKDRDTDKEYLREIKTLFTEAGLEELFFTSDTPTKGRDYGAIEGVLQTANFNEKATLELNTLKGLQPDKPAMVMEFWTGWFDHWGESHHGMTLEDFKSVLEEILKFPSGVNFYMFHGGTTFGFLSGGNVYNEYPYFLPDISSYDYDAPLSEDGDYTEKYNAASELLEKYQKVKLRKPDRPEETKKTEFEPLKSTGYLDWDTLLSQVDQEDIVSNAALTYMEKLSINQGSGQNFGYIVYRKRDVKVGANSNLNIVGKINGAAMVVVDNKLLSPPLKSIEDMYTFGYWCTNEINNTLNLQVETDSIVTVDIIVENWSRNNYGKLANDDFKQFRGLSAADGNQVKITGIGTLEPFSIYPLQFKGKWVQKLKGWKEYKNDMKGPVMIRFELEVSEPADTFLDMQGWGKGIVFVNGFNVGRYSTIGPVHSLFVPRPLLKTGKNQIYVFEHFTPATQLNFSKQIIFKDAGKTFNVDL